MKAIDMSQGLFVLQFEPAPGGIEGLNLLVLVAGEEALFLDTGHEACMEAALRFLAEMGAKPVGAVLSHYHDDHADGLALLPGIETWGSAACGETLARCYPPERHAALRPRHALDGPESIAFGGHRLEIFPLPGHSPDSLGVLVDGRVLYAADSLLFTNEGEPLLPSVHARPVGLHAESLRRLREYLDLDFVPGHGAPVTDRALREGDLANRISYLEAIAAHAGPGLGIGFEEAQAGCSPKFRGREWHEENYR